MDTLIEDPATQETTVTPASDQPEGNGTTDTPADGKQEDAAELQKQLEQEKKRNADKDRYIKELESKKKKADTPPKDLADLEWRLENKERIAVVKDEYDAILSEGYNGEKVSNKIALELAEKMAKIDSTETKRTRQDDISTPSTTVRNIDMKGYETEEDRALGLTLERKRKLEEKYPHLKNMA